MGVKNEKEKLARRIILRQIERAEEKVEDYDESDFERVTKELANTHSRKSLREMAKIIQA